MTFEHGQQGSQKYPYLPGNEESIMLRAMPIASQDLRVGHVTQGVGGLLPEVNRKCRNWNLSQSPMWSYRSPENKAPGEFNDRDDKLLRNAVASGEAFSYIKSFMFLNRPDIDTKALEFRAHKIGALWGKEEDEWLYCLITKWEEFDRGFIENLKNNWLTWRDADTLRARIHYLKKNPPVNGFPHSIQYHDFHSLGNYPYSDPLRKPTTGPTYPATGPYEFVPGVVNQHLEASDAGLAQTDTNDHVMDPYEFEIGDMPTDGPHHQHGYNVVDDASEDPIDDMGHLDAGPSNFLPEGPDEIDTGPDTTPAANDYNSLIDPSEYEYMNTPNEAFHQSHQHTDHSISPYVSELPTVDQSYPDSDACSSEPGTDSQSQHSPEVAQQSPPPDEPGYPEHGSSHNSHEPSIERAQTGRLTLGRLREIKKGLIRDLPEIKKRLAQGWTLPEVNAEYCPQYRCDPMRKFLWGHGCVAWGRLQDKQVLGLQREGNNWAQISKQLTDPCRTEEEVQDRFLWLMGMPGEE